MENVVWEDEVEVFAEDYRITKIEAEIAETKALLVLLSSSSEIDDLF